MSRSDITNLAVRFRVNDPNLAHYTVLEDMKKLGLAFLYGIYRGTPERNRKQLRYWRNKIAEALDGLAQKEKVVLWHPTETAIYTVLQPCGKPSIIFQP